VTVQCHASLRKIGGGLSIERFEFGNM
jgi:hypothetical protein